MALRVLLSVLVVGLLSLSGGAARAQADPIAHWSGTWVDRQNGQGGYLEFVLMEDGMITGNITNGSVVGTWNGFVRNDGAMFAEYSYPSVGFSALAASVVTEAQGNMVAGSILFVTDDYQVLGFGEFVLTRVSAVPAAGYLPVAANAPATDDGYSGEGMYVYCAAASVCGDRGANTLPGDWSWTSDLFAGIEESYPHVWCEMYMNAC